MRYAGRLQQWNDRKGYGFVAPHDGGARAFVHVRDFQVSGRRPADGDLVSYETSIDAKGRLKATNVRFAGQRILKPAASPATRSGGGSKRLPRTAIGMTFLLATTAAMVTGLLPATLALAYLLMSAVSFIAYGLDKAAARRARGSRTPEATLHLLDLLGGWPGGLVAQQLLRHKTSKASYQAGFWVSVASNLALAAWLWRSGVAAAILQDLPG